MSVSFASFSLLLGVHFLVQKSVWRRLSRKGIIRVGNLDHNGGKVAQSRKSEPKSRKSGRISRRHAYAFTWLPPSHSFLDQKVDHRVKKLNIKAVILLIMFSIYDCHSNNKPAHYVSCCDYSGFNDTRLTSGWANQHPVPFSSVQLLITCRFDTLNFSGRAMVKSQWNKIYFSTYDFRSVEHERSKTKPLKWEVHQSHFLIID